MESSPHRPPAAPVALLLVALLLPALLPAAAAAEEPDPRVAWLCEHALAVSSLDPASPGFQDLEPLKEALAGVRVVLLGEASHGDGTSLLAKSRLVAFLHREMGFDLLAFEAGLYAGDRAWQRIQAGAEAREALGPTLPLAPRQLSVGLGRRSDCLEKVTSGRYVSRVFIRTSEPRDL